MSAELAVGMYGGRWKRYPAYRDSGVEWIGEVPEGWDVKQLKYIVAQRVGAIKTGPFGSQLLANEMTSGDFKVYNQRNVIDRNVTFGENYVSQEKYEKLSSFNVFPKDILLTTRGTIGRCFILPEDVEPGILHPCLMRIQSEPKFSLSNFLTVLIQDSSLVQTQLFLMSNATTIEVIYSETMRNILLPIPPISEQKQILAFLDRETGRIDTLIEKKEAAGRAFAGEARRAHKPCCN